MSLRSVGSGLAISALFLVGSYFAYTADRESEVETVDPVATTTTSTVTTTSTTGPSTTSSLSPTTTATPRATPTTHNIGSSDPSEALAFIDLFDYQIEPIPETTTTTVANAPAVAASGTPAPLRIQTPSCAASRGVVSSVIAPLTGRGASIPSGMPAVVVKVSNNSSKSRAALIGLDSADIVYEERIEANATRFAAVFHSSFPANVGPVRSGRTTDIELIRNLNKPVFGYSGSNPGVASQIDTAAAGGWLVPFVNTDRAPFARDSRYRAPDNLFVDAESLGACGNGGTPPAIFQHSSSLPAAAQAASSVSLDARSPFRFDWNGTGSWDRSQSGYAHATREGTRLSPENVVVLFVDYVQSAIDKNSVDARSVGTGEVWVFRDGTATFGTWSRPKVGRAFTLTAHDGTSIPLAPGQSWVVLAPAGSASWS